MGIEMGLWCFVGKEQGQLRCAATIRWLPSSVITSLFYIRGVTMFLPQRHHRSAHTS